MQQPIVIRGALPGEAERLQELGITGWETTYASFLEPANRRGYLAGPFWSIERLVSLIENAACLTLIAEIDGTIAGFLTIEPRLSGEVELTRFYVDPAYRGNGIGRVLWEQALETLRRNNERSVLVNVFGDNRDGRRFYERLGYSLIEETTTVVGSQTVYDVWYRLALR